MSDAEEPQQPQPCMPCNGGGKVISNLGGTPRTVTCPWCHGDGVRIAAADAQEWRREQDAKRI
ncbi:MAG TPA: hypothetical protein VHU13_09305 [Solirubrobacteraceae bacterium]|nr:hypothetical protein [Solirubrobacteraceae bacterium]